MSSVTSTDITTALGYTPMRGLNNLSELTNTTTARTNLGLGSASLLNTGDVVLVSNMPANCGVGQTLTFSSPTNSWTCSNIVLANNSVTNSMISSVDWSKVQNTPNTLAGYGIGDAVGTATAFSGDVTGTYSNTSVIKIRGVLVDTTASTPISGDVLRFDGTKYVATALPSAPVSSVAGKTGAVTLTSADITGLGAAAGLNVGTTAGTVAAGNDARFTDARAPSGTASGDLSGTYPNPNVAKIQGQGVTLTLITSGDILQYNGVGFVNRNIPTCGANQYLTFNGSVYSCVTDSGSAGTVASVSVTAPIQNTGTATNPIIALNKSTAGQDGYLSSADFTAFTNKLGTTTVFSGDVTGTYNNTSVTKIRGVAVDVAASAPTSGDVLRFDGTKYIATALPSAPVTSVAGKTGVVNLVSSDITGLGTLAGKSSVNLSTDVTGTLPIANGGTGATTAGAARTNLGLGSASLLNSGDVVLVSNMPANCGAGQTLTFSSPTGTWSCTNIVLALNSGKILIGNGSNIAVEQSISGDATLASNGQLTLANTVTAGTGTKLTFDSKGRITASGNLTSADISGFVGTNFAKSLAAPTVTEDAKSLRWNNTTGQWEWFTAGVAGAGITNLNGQSGNAQTFAVNNGGTFGFSSASNVHTLNIPSANGATTGLLSSADYTTFAGKLNASANFSGDVTGAYNLTSVIKIRGVPVDVAAATPTSGDVLRYDGTKYIATALPSAPVSSVAGKTGAVTLTSSDITGLGAAAGMNVGTLAGTVAAGNDARLTDSRAPSGTASGDLSGTYPNPTLGKIQGTALSISSLTNGNFLKYNGTNWVNTNIVSTDVSNAQGYVQGGNSFGTTAKLGTKDAQRLAFITNNTEKMTIQSNGNVGIGTSPSEVLHINGRFRQDAPAGLGGFIQVNGQNLASGTTINPGIDVFHDATNIYGTNLGYTSATARYNVQSIFPTHADFVVSTHASNVLPTQNSDFTARFIVRGDTGNVGIGTTAPGAKLEVAGQVKITGGTPGLGKVLTSDAAGLATWQTPAAGGITSITANSPLAKGGTSSDPTLSIAKATGAADGYLSSVDWTTFNTKLGTSTVFSGDVSGTASTTSVDKLKGTPITLSSPASGDFLKYNGTNWVNSSVSIWNLKNSLGTVQVPNTCTASQTMTWSAVSDTFSCANIAINIAQISGLANSASIDTTNASNITSGTLSAARLPTSVTDGLWSANASGDVYRASGNVGIGTTTPGSLLHIGGYNKITVGSLISSTNTAVTVSNMTGNSEFITGQDDANRLSIGWVYNATPANSYGVLGTVGLNPLVLQSAGGNVGIGTNAPAAKLHISTLASDDGTIVGNPISNNSIGLYTNGNGPFINFDNTSATGSNVITWIQKRPATDPNPNHLAIANGNGDIILQTSGNIGIGTTTPTAPLDIIANNSQVKFLQNTNGGIWGSNAAGNFHLDADATKIDGSIYLNYFNGKDVKISNGAGGINAVFKQNGNVGIGTTAPSEKLDVAGNVAINGSGSLIMGGQTVIDANGGWMRTYGGTGWFNGTYGGGMYMVDTTYVRVYANKVLYADNYIQSGTAMYSPAYYYTSDRKLKRDIASLNNPLDTVTKLRGVSFNWKNSGEKDIGFIAQEVENVVPELVKTRKETDGDEVKTVKYGNIVAIVVEAIKELAANVFHNSEAIKSQNLKIEKLEQDVKDLKIQNQLLLKIICEKNSSVPNCK